MYWLLWQEYYKQLLDFQQQACAPSSRSAVTVNNSEQQSAAPQPPAMGDASIDIGYESLLLEHSNQAMCVWHPIEGCVYHSQNWEHITRLSKDVCDGTGWFDFIHPDYHNKLFNALEQFVGTGSIRHSGLPNDIQIQMANGDETWSWFNLQFVPAAQHANNDGCLGMIVRNIDSDMQVQQDMHQAQTASRVAEQSRSKFLANMSHELRTPLNAILGFTQMIQSEVFGKLNNAAYSEYVENIQESGTLLLSRVNDLLELANMDVGRMELHDLPVNVNDIVNAAIEMHSHAAFSKQVSLRNELAKRAVVLRADRIKLTHCLSNLLANAIEHSSEGDEIAIEGDIDGRGCFIFRVCDSGSGIASAKLRSIQEALSSDQSYYQAESEGIGIGLALARELTALHEGTLSITSTKKGTEASVMLPKDRVISLSARIKTKDKIRQAVAA